MAWDSKSALQRRQDSNTHGPPTPMTGASTTGPEMEMIKPQFPPKSAHVADPSLQAFLDPAFDAASYLNAALPALQTPTSRMTGREGNRDAFPLGEVAGQTQALLAHLGAHASRLTATLTTLTDEILRSGSRLAYEVEVLRGETVGLTETLVDGLHDEVALFVPAGLEPELVPKPAPTITAQQHHRRRSSAFTRPKTPITSTAPNDGEPTPPAQTTTAAAALPTDPAYITQLRTLTLVRTRLDAVIKIFGDAMNWTLPPSELSVAASFVSVSGPEPTSASAASADTPSREAKAQETARALRQEIADLLLAPDPASDHAATATTTPAIAAIEAAARRVQELRDLAVVWRSTAEEKPRARFVDGLARLVEDRHRELLQQLDDPADPGAGRLGLRVAALQRGAGDATVAEEEEEEERSLGGYGFINRLQKLRGAA